MKDNTKIEELINKLKDSNYAEILNKTVLGDIENGYNNYAESYKRLESEDKILTIGIVGQVNAGKSSFLNALFFDSKEIIPKAATPMTAALTKIRYSENISAKVHFFSLEDWKTIEKGYKECKNAIQKERDKINENLKKVGKPTTELSDIQLLGMVESGELSDSYKSFYEIYEDFKKNEKELTEKLENSESGDNYETIEGADTVDALKDKLENYVGASGKYTPIVKYVELFLNVEAIKDFDIVDTPGLNDPVTSRGAITRNFLGKCDVIFLLSPAGQFFDSQDISLFTEQLPQEGIKEVVVIGSKFDTGMNGESQKYNGDIKVAQIKVKETLNEQFKARIKDSRRKDIFEKAFPPRYISSICYDIYKHYGGALSKDEAHAKKQIMRAFPHFKDSAENFRELSDIDVFNEEIIPKIAKKKEKIFEDRKNDIYSGFIEKFRDSIEELYDEVRKKQDKFLNEDVKSIEEKLKSSLNNLSKRKNKINDCYDEKTTDIKREFKKLIDEISDIIDSNSEVKVQQRQEEYTVMVEKEGPLSGVCRFFGGIFGTDWGYRRETRTKNISYALTQDAIEQITKAVGYSQKIINQAFENIFNIKDFTENIASKIVEASDLADSDFDTDSIILPLKKVLRSMTISSIKVNKDYDNLILERVSNKSETSVKEMREVMRQTTKDIFKDIEKSIEEETEVIISKLDEQGNNLIKDISASIEKDAEELKNQLKDKKKYEEMYKEAISDIEKIKNSI